MTRLSSDLFGIRLCGIGDRRIPAKDCRSVVPLPTVSRFEIICPRETSAAAKRARRINGLTDTVLE